MEVDLKRSKWRAYMREYRKRDYVKRRYHEYYIRKLIEQSAKDNEGINMAQMCSKRGTRSSL